MKDDDSENLELDISSVKLNICKDLPKVKELLRVLTAKKTKKTYTIIDKIEEPQIHNIANQPRNISVKHIGKKKALFTIIGLLE